MTVEELIERLKRSDPAAQVLLADWNEEYRDPAPFGILSVTDWKGCVVLGADESELESKELHNG